MSFVSIPIADLPAMIGKPIHLKWAYHGTVWILDRIDGGKIECHTPKTGKRMVSDASDAQYVRRFQPIHEGAIPMVVSTSKIITPVFRVSYAHIWKPQEQESNGKKRNCWSVTAIFGKKQPNGTLTDLSKLYALANELKKAKFPNGGIIKMPWKDGNDPEKVDLNKNPEYKDSIIMTFRSYDRPVGLVDANRQPILEQEKFYSGCFALASVNAFSYDLPTSKGVSFGLCNLMKVCDGEPLSAVHKAEVDFAEVRLEDLGIDNSALFGSGGDDLLD